jgi:hypothetical protein
MGFLPAYLDTPLVGLIQTVKDVHQGCFSGAVFSQKCVDLSGKEIKVDMIIRQDTGKRFGYTGGSNEWLSVHVCLPQVLYHSGSIGSHLYPKFVHRENLVSMADNLLNENHFKLYVYPIKTTDRSIQPPDQPFPCRTKSPDPFQ